MLPGVIKTHMYKEFDISMVQLLNHVCIVAFDWTVIHLKSTWHSPSDYDCIGYLVTYTIFFLFVSFCSSVVKIYLNYRHGYKEVMLLGVL